MGRNIKKLNQVCCGMVLNIKGGVYMNRRIAKKRAKIFMDKFTRNVIPKAFKNETDRKHFVSAWARRYVGQSAHFPEGTKDE